MLSVSPDWRFKPAAYEVDVHNPEIPLAPWAGHRQFAYDYIVNIRPNVVVELGTYHGCAFFAFCQAAKDHGLDATRLFAVDTWKGTAHDGFYGEEVFETFKALCAGCFPGLSTTAVRKLFTEAAPDFQDDSVDLLHVDGTHTYAAAEEDYCNWLPKMAQEGVIFFHDVFTERHGTTRFFRELSAQHPSLLFEHCFGLGLLFPKGDKLYRHMLSQGLAQLIPFYTRCGELEMALAQSRAEQRRQAEEAQAGLNAAVEEAVAQAREETAKSRSEAAAWWQKAMDAQWKLDQLEGKDM